MRELLSRVFSSQGIRGPVITLVSGSSAALVIALVTQPVLTRLYKDPDLWGLYGFFTATMAVLITFTGLRYEDGLMFPEKDEDAGAVAWLGFLVVSFFAAAAAGLTIWRSEIAALAKMPDAAPFLMLIPIALIAMRGTKLAELWLTRERAFRVISGGQVANAATMSSSRIAAGMPPVSAGAAGLIGGYVAGNVINFVILAVILFRRSSRVLRRAFRWRKIAEAAKRYRRFPLFSMPATLSAALVMRMPLFLIPVYFYPNHKAIAGMFTLAFSNTSIPLACFSRAVAQVFFVGAVEAQAKNRLNIITEGVHRRLVMVMLFPALVILVCGPDIFAVVFGKGFREAGNYAQFLVPWLFLGSVCSPLSRIYDVTQRQRLDFLMGFVSLGTVIGALVAGGLTRDVRTFLWCLCIGGCLARCIQLNVLSRLARVRLSRMLAPYLRYLTFALPCLALMIGVVQVGKPLLTVAAALAGTGMYGALVLWKEKPFG